MRSNLIFFIVYTCFLNLFSLSTFASTARGSEALGSSSPESLEFLFHSEGQFLDPKFSETLLRLKTTYGEDSNFLDQKQNKTWFQYLNNLLKLAHSDGFLLSTSPTTENLRNRMSAVYHENYYFKDKRNKGFSEKIFFTYIKFKIIRDFQELSGEVNVDQETFDYSYRLSLFEKKLLFHHMIAHFKSYLKSSYVPRIGQKIFMKKMMIKQLAAFEDFSIKLEGDNRLFISWLAGLIKAGDPLYIYKKRVY